MRGQEVFVLDTNVLIFAPEALEAFSDAEIVIPINVIEEPVSYTHLTLPTKVGV